MHAIVDASFSLTSSPLGPYLMCAPSLGQVWVLRVPLGFGPRLAGCVRHFRHPPSSGRCLARCPSAFSFPLPFQGLHALGWVCWCWLVFSLFFLSSFTFPVSCPGCHLIFIVISSPLPFIFTFISFVGALKALLLWGVCVKHLNRCKTCTMIYLSCSGAFLESPLNEDTSSLL